MQVKTTKSNFSPITITLETEQELLDLLKILYPDTRNSLEGQYGVMEASNLAGLKCLLYSRLDEIRNGL